MGKKDDYEQKSDRKEAAKVEAVLEIIRKQTPLTLKQEKFCNYGCVKRFLKAKGDNVKKAAKQLRACLSWRDTIVTEYLIADDFSAELADGLAYVAGHDEESRPVLVDPLAGIHNGGSNFNDAKKRRRICDAFRRKSASAFMNMLVGALKIVAEYYPGRLSKAFVIDPPSLFAYLWKGVRPFVELSAWVTVVSSLEFEESMDLSHFETYPRASSLRFDPSTIKSTAKIGSCSSSRFSFTVSHHLDSLKPWYLSLTDTSASKVGPTSPALISPLNARSLSFASPVARTPRGSINGPAATRKDLFPSTPMPQRVTEPHRAGVASFLQSPAAFFRREGQVRKGERCRESFSAYLKFYRRPYDEMVYRSKMRPPLGGLISIVSPHLRRRHVSMSQRF
ncbi:hypothetical protein Ahy_A09g042355 [Arachis hypogaea]|uniref:CRAL-TRIO domain-containing protein n=1 Tax=Arachis hypogaea TaxID=3818 RepID=A0A445BFM6_ARAHY|nr:hypothetical protein Ahy_A09g042355 [Arachis hypogaea]